MKKLNRDKCVPVRVPCTGASTLHGTSIARDSAVYQPCTKGTFARNTGKLRKQIQKSPFIFFNECPLACMFVPVTSEIYLHYSNDDCTG